MTSALATALDSFVNLTIAEANQKGSGLVVQYDPQWPSECYLAESEEGDSVPWQPQRQSGNNHFGNVESALELTLNSQYCEFFTRYFSDNLSASAPKGQCELLQVWNDDDFARLQENLIGHLLMKKRLKQEPTLFFALTDEDDFILSVKNSTGEVVLEQVGKSPNQVIATDLAHFIESLRPAV